MGLDMYAFKTRERIEDVNAHAENQSKPEQIEIAYWRKHHDLHGFMRELWTERTGNNNASDFNCIPLELSLADLDRLKHAIVHGELPPTTGFFFGNNPPDDESNRYDLEFIDNAIQAKAEGFHVYYDSWW